jgi:hypothetical protein
VRLRTPPTPKHGFTLARTQPHARGTHPASVPSARGGAFRPAPQTGDKSFIFSHAVALDEASAFRCEWRARHCFAGRQVDFSFFSEEKTMARKAGRQPLVRKPTRQIADSRRVRYGNGCAPAKLVRPADAAVSDSGVIRFGNGCAPASLRK